MYKLSAEDFTQVATELLVWKDNQLLFESTCTWMQSVLNEGVEIFHLLDLAQQVLFCWCVNRGRKALDHAILRSLGLGFFADQPDMDDFVDPSLN